MWELLSLHEQREPSEMMEGWPLVENNSEKLFVLCNELTIWQWQKEKKKIIANEFLLATFISCLYLLVDLTTEKKKKEIHNKGRNAWWWIMWFSNQKAAKEKWQHICPRTAVSDGGFLRRRMKRSSFFTPSSSMSISIFYFTEDTFKILLYRKGWI